MSESAAGLRHKIDSALDLHTIVRTMKAVAASNIGQYENAVMALDDYYRTVQLGLAACSMRSSQTARVALRSGKKSAPVCLIVFGSSQGLVGQFNDVVAEFVIGAARKLPGRNVIWTVGERIRILLGEADLAMGEIFNLPNSISAITSLLEQMLVKIENHREQGDIDDVILFFNHPLSGEIYSPISQCLFPLDQAWNKSMIATAWPTNNLPEVINGAEAARLVFLREYLFVSIFRACAQSQASENISRLAAMQRAEKNIEEVLRELNKTYHQVRQSTIDEELFELVSGFEALSKSTALKSSAG